MFWKTLGCCGEGISHHLPTESADSTPNPTSNFKECCKVRASDQTIRDTRTLEFQGWDFFVHGKWKCDTPTHSIKSILCLSLGLPSMSQTWMQQNVDYIWWYWYWKVNCWIDWSVLIPATRFNTTIFDDERTTWNLLGSKNIVCLCVCALPGKSGDPGDGTGIQEFIYIYGGL